VRENGGQYTHSAVWTIMAFALMGRTERAWELFALINPILHGATSEDIAIYKVEPYVAAADVYAVHPHTGRGGWTWYTGTAAWMYRLVVECLLGVNREGDHLLLEPKFPAAWNSYKVHYRFHHTVYHLTFSRQPAGSPGPDLVTVDGVELIGNRLPLCNDHQEHAVEVSVGSAPTDPQPS